MRVYAVLIVLAGWGVLAAFSAYAGYWKRKAAWAFSCMGRMLGGVTSGNKLPDKR